VKFSIDSRHLRSDDAHERAHEASPVCHGEVLTQTAIQAQTNIVKALTQVFESRAQAGTCPTAGYFRKGDSSHSALLRFVDF